MNHINYFEVLRISPQASDEEVRIAKTAAGAYWQQLELTALDNKMRTQAQEMRLAIDDAYARLSSTEARKSYQESIVAINAEIASKKFGAIEIKVKGDGEFGNLNFTVVENPVSHPLVIGKLPIQSLQEFVCRAYEKPEELGLVSYQNRALERWMYYSAQETDITNAMQYYRWEFNSRSQEDMLYLALDLIQARYPAPIIPRSEPTILESIKQYQQPSLQISPQLVNFDLLPNKLVSQTVFLRAWKSELGEINASVDSPLVKLDTSQLNRLGQLTVSINGAEIKAGEPLAATISIESAIFGKKQVPVFGIRYKWFGFFNQGAARDFNLRVAVKLMELENFEPAAKLYLEAGASQEAAGASKKAIMRSAKQHLWQDVIKKIPSYNLAYGRDAELSLLYIEALRLIGGSFYQLQQYKQALSALTSLVGEWNLLPNRKLPESTWTSKNEAQVSQNLNEPKIAWVEAAEALDLVWTHAWGKADKSGYAGPQQLSLANMKIFWSLNYGVQEPIIASQGILVARRRDNKALLGIEAATGTKLWEHSEGLQSGKSIAEPVCHAKDVFLADAQGGIYCLDIQTGKKRWMQTIENKRDINLAYQDGILLVATGDQVLFLDTKKNGELLTATGKMRGLFGGANPTNLLLTDGHVAFQKGTMFKKSMQFININTGSSLEFDIPNGMNPPSAWAASQGYIFIPTLITVNARIPDTIRTYQDGRQEIASYKDYSWDLLELNVFRVDHNKLVAYIRDVVPGPRGSTYLTEVPHGSQINESKKSVDVVSVAPVGGGFVDGRVRLEAFTEESNLGGFAIAIGVGKYSYNCLILEDQIEFVRFAEMDSAIQSILFNATDDLVITEKTLTSSSFASNLTESKYQIPQNLRPISGNPAIYGSIIYFVNNAGYITALGK